MRVSIRWKLLVSYLFLLLVTGATLAVYLTNTLEDKLVARISETLHHEAALAAFAVAREGGEARRTAPAVANEIDHRIQARVTIMTEDGEVIGDSEVPAAALSTLENHRSRPEMLAALKTGSGSAIRYSTTLRTQMLYVAIRFIGSDTHPAVLRLALPLSSVDQTKGELHATLAMALGLASLLAIGLSLLLSGFAARTLRELTVGAARFGGGHFGRRLKVRSRDELGDLTEVMNVMAERLQAQMASLDAERNRLDAILRGMGEGLLVTDAGGAVTLVNPAFHALFELDAEPAGQPLAEVCRHPALLETFRRVQESRTEQVAEIVLPRPVEITLLTHWVPLVDAGMPAGVVAVFHDISDLKRLERVRRDFVANVSHELRTPITVIRGYAETLTGGAVEPDVVARFAAIIQAHAERLANLVGDLLTLSELEAKGSSLTLMPIALADAVEHCRLLLAPQAEQRQISIDTDNFPALEVLADRQRLEQVLINLIDNAVKYTPAGGQVVISAVTEGEYVNVSVRDSGPGIPLHEQTRIFERFYRIDAGRSRDQGGTGLGLAIVKHIVQLHGGTIGVESLPGQGACFTFTLRRG